MLLLRGRRRRGCRGCLLVRAEVSRRTLWCRLLLLLLLTVLDLELP